MRVLARGVWAGKEGGGAFDTHQVRVCARAQGYTPLMLAAGKGHVHSMLLLIDRGAKIDASNEMGQTALHIAAQNGHAHAVKVRVCVHAGVVLVDGWNGWNGWNGLNLDAVGLRFVAVQWWLTAVCGWAAVGVRG